MKNKTNIRKKVVIVEDDRLLAIVLKKMALSLNYDVLDISKTGDGAVKSVKKHNPDLVFMDIMLADDTNGIEAMKLIREHSDVPVIYITALSDSSVRKQATEVPNSFYMVKPVNFNDLKTTVQGINSVAA